ncbi:hypothetical protein P4C99_15035 [Pontiellaceae bacterium B1224]|nr:hypothetical protein [Pontiellaceae bacterium B1224]
MRILNTKHQLNLQTAPYWITLSILLLWGIFAFLNYVLILSFAVPAVGAHKRGSLRWKIFSVSTVIFAVAFLAVQYFLHGPRGMVLFNETGAFGSCPRVNFLSLLGVLLIFSPLSSSCAIDRIRNRSKLNSAEQ